MPIEKINAATTQTTANKQLISPQKEEKDAIVKDDKEISTKAKYMIGATAVAGIIALGIIGHKNNWWRKAEQLVQNEGIKPPSRPSTAPNPHSENIIPPKADLSYTRTETENGYILESNITKKRFERNKDTVTYSHKLENGSTLRLYSGTSSGSNDYGITYFTGEVRQLAISDKNGIRVYDSIFEEIASNSITEKLVDKDNMYYYRANSAGQIIKQKITSIDKTGGISLKPKKEIIKLEDFQQVRKRILKENLPSNYDRLVDKYVVKLPNKLVDETKEFYRFDNFKKLIQNLKNDWKSTTYKSQNEYTHIINIEGSDCYFMEPLYLKRILKSQNIQSETINLPNGSRITKIVDLTTNETKFQTNGYKEEITQDMFEQLKDMVMSNVGKKVTKKSFQNKYQVSYDADTGKFSEYTKLDDNGRRIERVLVDFDDESKLIVIPYENGRPLKDQKTVVNLEDFDFSDVIADQKKYFVNCYL